MDNKPKAVALMLASALFFAFMGAMVKKAGNLPVFEKVFFRNLISLIVAFSVVRKSGSKMFGKKENQGYLLARSLMGLLGVILYFYAISNMYLADSAMLNKLSPFFVTLFACLFLKEKLSKIQIPALIVVFIAVLLIIKPRFDFSIVPALAGFISAVFAGAAYTLVRFLKDKEEPSTVVFYFSFVSVVGMLPLMLLNFKVPTVMQLVYLLSTGVFAAFAQFSLTIAYKYAPASEIAIYNYSNIIFSAIIGFFIWNEIPDKMSIVGGIIIIVTAMLVYLYNKNIDCKDKQ
ncbi:DMT family transporter [Haloimpatiens sp. FM7330]|uniref:DMT family transporter n=1 Tax=Haloimpatiens sp. FM7330 TaxID=3298610 RepID=UPI00363D8CC4